MDQQPNLFNRSTRWGAWVAIAITIASAFEGFSAKPYVDRVGRGHPETWCYGTTASDHPAPPYGTIFTKLECQTMLGSDLLKYDTGVKKYVHVIMGPNTEAAMVDAAYNLGPNVFAHGSMTRYLNAGGNFTEPPRSTAYRHNHSAACEALKSYNRASGRVLTGLVRRRKAEAVLCHKDD